MNQKAQKARSAEMPAVILFGKDETSKPHASFFPESDLAGALNAAALMKMRVLRTDTAARRAVAADLPQGRVFASGKAFVPFVAAPLYQRLIALAAGADAVRAPGAGSTANEPNRGPAGQIEGQTEGGDAADPAPLGAGAPRVGADSIVPTEAGF